MAETKLIRVYTENEPKLIELRRDLTRQKGEQASYADVVRWLIEECDALQEAFDDLQEYA